MANTVMFLNEHTVARERKQSVFRKPIPGAVYELIGMPCTYKEVQIYCGLNYILLNQKTLEFLRIYSPHEFFSGLFRI